MDGVELAQLAGTIKDLTFSAALLFVLFAAMGRKWVPGVYYQDALARISKLESLLDLAHEAADRAVKVSETALGLMRERD